MHQKTHQITISIGGKDVTFETGKIARHANGAVTVRCGDTIILATACASSGAVEGASFLPLRVDYQERASSAGKTLGGFIKREGKLAEREILGSRLIDRPLRPMFPDGYHNEVQVLTFVLSYDATVSPEPLAICAASAALSISDIPLIKPVGAVKVGLIDGKYVINPSIEEQKKSRLDLIIAGTEDAVLMIEGYCDFLTEEQLLEAIDEGQKSIKNICQEIEKWQLQIGRHKSTKTIRPLPHELLKEIDTFTGDAIKEAISIKDKLGREITLSGISEEVVSKFKETHTSVDIHDAFQRVKADYMRKLILKEKKRSDGRACDEVRPISIELDPLPRTHGSVLFTRGETQAIGVCTLGSESMGQRYEDLHGEGIMRFYLQYHFPPFSVGEVGRMGPPGRREIGHGKLAERALTPILPKQEAFPYTIRLESTITESNGSSSMATACAGSLALMLAGVPISRPISGIAMGLILEENEYAILSDILGVEDALGDMDFKVTGDAEGITAFQLDIKVEGINRNIMKAALAQAKKGRLTILEKMLAACPQAKKELSDLAPRIENIQIKPNKIGTIIGPGGKQIRALEEFGVKIDISDLGMISISSNSKQSIEKARAVIEGLVAEVEIGKIYQGKVVSIVPFGAFVEILPGKEGLCHISELSHKRVERTEDVCQIGDTLEVKVLEINMDRNQIRLSHKAVLERPQSENRSGPLPIPPPPLNIR